MSYEDLKFEFAKYTEITDLSFELNPEYKTNGYIRFFICPDVRDFWFIRILKGFNKEYEEDSNSYLLERNKIAKFNRSQVLSLNKVKRIIKDDNGESWDIESSYNLDELIDMLDDGYGILNKKE